MIQLNPYELNDAIQMQEWASQYAKMARENIAGFPISACRYQQISAEFYRDARQIMGIE